MAKEVHVIYGGQYIEWDLLIAALEVFLRPQMSLILTSSPEYLYRKMIPTGLTHSLGIKVLRDQVQSREPMSLCEVLHSCFACEATDTRDKIFASQGLAFPILPTFMHSNYGLPEVDVYLRTS
jgi:hypothetical protein